MKDKTEQKVQAIKSGKFGVEIEMYNIHIRDVVDILTEMWDTELSVESTGHLSGRRFKDRQGRWWIAEYDSSIHESNGSCELVTPILGYDDIDLLQEVVRTLRSHGARANAEHECGIHVHLDADSHTPDTLRALTNLVYSHEQLLLKALQVDSRRDRWCKLVDPEFLSRMNIMKPKTMEQVKRIWYEANGSSLYSADDHYNSTRYHLMNFHSLFEGKGIELRCFQFSARNGHGVGMHAGELKAYIQFSLALNAMAISAPFAKHKIHQIQTDNPKYSMCSFLSRLGLRGDEFDTVRKILTEALDGTSRPRRPRQSTSTAVPASLDDIPSEADIERASDERVARMLPRQDNEDLDRELNEAVRTAELA